MHPVWFLPSAVFIGSKSFAQFGLSSCPVGKVIHVQVSHIEYLVQNVEAWFKIM